MDDTLARLPSTSPSSLLEDPLEAAQLRGEILLETGTTPLASADDEATDDDDDVDEDDDQDVQEQQQQQQDEGEDDDDVQTEEEEDVEETQEAECQGLDPQGCQALKHTKQITLGQKDLTQARREVIQSGFVGDKNKGKKSKRNVVSAFVGAKAPRLQRLVVVLPGRKKKPAPKPTKQQLHIKYRLLIEKLIRRLTREEIRHRGLMRKLKKVQTDKERKRTLSHLRRCNDVLRALTQRSRRIRRLMYWTERHESELPALAAWQVPSINGTQKVQPWRPYMARALRKDFNLGRPRSLDPVKEPEGFNWRNWMEQDKAHEKAKAARRRLARARAAAAKDASKRAALRRAEEKARAAAAKVRALKRKAKAAARERDRRRRQEDLAKDRAQARLKKALNSPAKTPGAPRFGGSPAAGAAGLKVRVPKSERIPKVEVAHAYAIAPAAHNRDESSKEYRDLSDVRRLVDGSVRTLWRYRTGGSKQYGVVLRLPSAYTVTGIRTYVEQSPDFPTGFAGVKVEAKTGNSWRLVGEACGMYGEYAGKATDVCGNDKPAKAVNFSYNRWVSLKLRPADSVTELRLTFGSAEQQRDSAVSLSEIRVYGYRSEGPRAARAVKIENDNKKKEGSTCQLGDKCQPAESCLAIKKARPTAVSAPYSINYLGKVYELFCDMETQGGGWTALINPNFIPNLGLPLKATANRLGGDINTCGMRFYRDKLYGFHRLKGYACGNYQVEWLVEWRNTIGAKEVLLAGAIQGHDLRSLSVNGKNVAYRSLAGTTDGNVCSFFNAWDKGTQAGLNNCWNMDYSTGAPRYVKFDELGPRLTVRITSGTACKPTCQYGTGFNLQQLYVR